MRSRKLNRRAHSKNNINTLAVINVLFLICFIIYQVILSKSNGGREAVASTYRSFLKGGPGPREDPAVVVHSGNGIGDNFQKESTEETQPKIEMKIQKESTEENLEGIPQRFIDHDPFSEENEIQPQSNTNSKGDRGESARSGSNRKDFPIEGPGQAYVFNPDIQMFHNYNKGKSGKVIEEMLMAHAYIFHQNATYGGCCGDRNSKMTTHEDLLDALGLKDVLRFRCPRDFIHDTKTKRSVIPTSRYMAQDTLQWTPEYVDYLRSLVVYPERRHNEYTIVVHMLRGNTSPCKKKNRGYHSYLPNLHYQNLIDKYMKPGARVIIYTQAKSFESLSEFQNRGYEVNTGMSLKETWKDFVTVRIARNNSR